MITSSAIRPVGKLLREWRQRRRMSQLDFAGAAEISTRHLSFLETGRAQPSREMVLRLSELLEVPLRERNAWLLAAGFAPVFAERPLSDPALKAARAAIDLVLKGHEPYPALAVDRHWNLVASNLAAQRLMADLSPELLQSPLNVLRASLHPKGLAPRIVNLAEWRGHILARLRHQVDLSADVELQRLLEELAAYPPADKATNGTTKHRSSAPADDYSGVVIPLQLASPEGVLSFISTTTLFGTPLDVTLSELAIEAFFPADESTGAALRGATAA